MRAIIGITCLLLGLGMLSCRVEGVGAVDRAETRAPKWVRTVDGWERPERWRLASWEPPRLHPLVMAAGQGLASVLALAAFSGRR